MWMSTSAGHELCLLLAAMATMDRMPTARAWGAGHAQVHSAALALQDVQFRALLNSTTMVWPPGSSATPMTLAALLSGPLAESADDVAGPCAANTSVPCSPAALATKITLRDFCYAENASGHNVRPWPCEHPPPFVNSDVKCVNMQQCSVLRSIDAFARMNPR